jgi:hypothetical protein
MAPVTPAPSRIFIFGGPGAAKASSLLFLATRGPDDSIDLGGR